MRTDHIDIPAGSTGATFNLAAHRFGKSGARPAVYIQAALHADEIPGMICATVLRRLLQEAEADGAIAGEVVLVPVANPIGLSQDVLGNPLGRFDLVDGGNFNRNFPSFGKALAERVGDALGRDEAANITLVRAALARLIEEHPATTAAEHLKKALIGLAMPCDIVLDLHCDAEASMHLYTHNASVETIAPLAARLGCTAVLIAENSGGDPFDEALSRPWADLAAARPDRPLPLSCHATTVELRGQSDVSWEFATSDAAAILGFLRDIGVLTGAPERVPARLCEPTPLAASLPLIAPVAGILTYQRDVGHRVAEGEVLATIIDPVSGELTEIHSPCDGMFFARTALRYVKPGKRLGKVAGRTAIRTGDLLSP
jgi:predicted deacylase